MKERTNVAYFYFAPPGEATVQAQGTVLRPGLYEVADSASLDRPLIFCGQGGLSWPKH
jgi:hypothetical protein